MKSDDVEFVKCVRLLMECAVWNYLTPVSTKCANQERNERIRWHITRRRKTKNDRLHRTNVWRGEDKSGRTSPFNTTKSQMINGNLFDRINLFAKTFSSSSFPFTLPVIRITSCFFSVVVVVARCENCWQRKSCAISVNSSSENE